MALAPARAQDAPDEKVIPDDLTKLSLEDLMNVEVTSVSKQKQRIADAPAAVYVINQEDIRRSGLSSIPELLRLAPGLNVARMDANKWAISSRGFQGQYANKLLVLMDGRAVYTPFFSGVYWDAQDTVLEDLDRIEVIRGPGATLWGANAVNGVINITTKSARDTQGLLFSGRTGTEEQIGSLRYGGKLDEQTYYRVYAKYRDVDNFDLPGGDEARDGWDALRGGFRVDRYATDQDTITILGNIFEADEGTALRLPTFVPPFVESVPGTLNTHGGDILARWTHVISDTSDFTLQLYYDRLERKESAYGYEQDTVDIDFQHRFAIGQRNELIWGLGYRLVSDSIDSTDLVMLHPSDRDTHLFSAFVQDRLTVVPERLFLFAGTKLEINSYTGLEIQPSARALWTPDEKNSVWAAISRAVRTPARWEEDGHAVLSRGIDPTTGLPLSVGILGHDDVESENLTAYELGYRFQPTQRISVDLATFYNSYDSLNSSKMLTPSFETTPPPPHLVVPLQVRNEIEGYTIGFEAAATWKVTDQWRLTGSYTFLDGDFRDATKQDTLFVGTAENSHPQNQLQLRSWWNITKDVELNAMAFYVDNVPGGDVQAYIRFDANVVWRLKKNIELSAGVQNLFDNRHRESGRALFDEAGEVPRAVYAQLVWRF